MGALVALLAVVLVAYAGKNRGARDGTFTFVAPGGQTSIFYDPPATRGTLRGLSGDSLADPGHTISVDEFPGQVVVLNIWASWCRAAPGRGSRAAAEL